ncbi:MAG: PIN domain-containing protein [Desulfobacterales bacterium]
MGLEIKAGDIIFLDTAPFIYFFERHPDYFPALESLFNQVYTQKVQVITSIITYIELTTHPARSGQTKLVRKYRDYLSHSENISLFPLDMNIADQAVRLRAHYQFKTPDAIQLGTAVACGADYVVTNDIAWQKFTEVVVLLVTDL